MSRLKEGEPLIALVLDDIFKLQAVLGHVHGHAVDDGLYIWWRWHDLRLGRGAPGKAKGESNVEFKVSQICSFHGLFVCWLVA